MGNKSKQRTKPGKWDNVRDLAQARQVKARNSWQGMASPRLDTRASKVGIAATDTERAHPLRQVHGFLRSQRVA